MQEKWTTHEFPKARFERNRHGTKKLVNGDSILGMMETPNSSCRRFERSGWITVAKEDAITDIDPETFELRRYWGEMFFTEMKFEHPSHLVLYSCKYSSNESRVPLEKHS